MIDLPRWDAEPGDTARCLAQIDEWAVALRDDGVVAAFSEAAARRLNGLHGAELLDGLESFAGAHWDFRGGLERNLALRPEFSSAQIGAVDSAAAEFGLSGTPSPRRGAYDAVIMTGGMVRAGIVKPRYARELYEDGLSWREGVFLGGFRTFAGDEMTLGPLLGVVGDNEFDAMETGMRLAFGLGDPISTESSACVEHDGNGESISNDSWREDAWKWNDRMLRVVAAPSSDPSRRRANTVDTFRFWGARAERIASVLVVTTPVYVPYQGASAIEVLGLEFGMAVETVAVSATVSDLGENSQVFLPHHLAQELRSAIHGFRSLRVRLNSAAGLPRAST